jgi:hypothetical protein
VNEKLKTDRKSVKRIAESTPHVKIVRGNLSKKIQEMDILFSLYFNVKNMSAVKLILNVNIFPA